MAATSTYWNRKVFKILVERSDVRPGAWLTMFTRLRGDIARLNGRIASIGEVSPIIDPREPLVWAWCVLKSMPESELQNYSRLHETEADGTGIGDGDALENLRAVGYAFEGIDTMASARLEWLATLVRCLDADLCGLNFDPSDGKSDDIRSPGWKLPGYPCFVIPVQRDFRLADGKPFSRRALRYHAILPATVAGCAVVPIEHPSLGDGNEPPPSSMRYGAALVPGLKVDIVPVGADEFMVREAPLPGALETIIGQVSSSIDSVCDMVAWPELALPEGGRAEIAAQLRRRALRPGRKALVVVAGSRHEPSGQQLWANRATVHDGRGGELFDYDKRRKYKYRPADKSAERDEAISPGRELPLIILEDRIVAVAICLDFCDDTVRDVYSSLDADIVIVPSMGDVQTLRAHLRHAKALQSLHDTVVFVVQQEPGASGDDGRIRGFSFCAPGGDQPPRQEAPFRVLTGRR